MTGNDPLISCVVPVFNSERFLLEAIHSILSQTWTAREIIVVDDGSTDGTPAIIAALGTKVRGVRQPNAGPAAARNAGIALATGSFVAFLDADDLWHSDKLARQMARFRERPELDVCFSQLRNVQAFDKGEGAIPLAAHQWPTIPFSPCTLLARRDVFERVGLFDPSLRRAEDTDWNIRMMLRGITYEVVPEVLLERRIHDRNLSLEHLPSPQDVISGLKLVLDRRRAEGW